VMKIATVEAPRRQCNNNPTLFSMWESCGRVFSSFPKATSAILEYRRFWTTCMICRALQEHHVK